MTRHNDVNDTAGHAGIGQVHEWFRCAPAVSEASPRLAVGAVLCISLQDRADRRAALLEEFSPFGLAVEFVRVERDAEDPERGCYRSHQHCAGLAVERGLRRVLILEDDARLDAWDAASIRRINRFLALRRPDLFHLGGIVGRMWRIPFPGVVRCRLTGCHAYILSAHACRWLAATPWAGEPVDSVLPRVFHGFAAYPMLFSQQPEDQVSSDLAAHRHQRLAGAAAVKDEAFWQRNRQAQHESVRRNWLRTLMLRWL